MALLSPLRSVQKLVNQTLKSPLTIRRQLGRSKKVAGMMRTMLGGYQAVTKLDAWREPPREVLPKYIQIFCRKMANSFGVEVVQVEPVPQTYGLWASNHVSWMDIPVIGSVSPAFFLSKAEVAQMPVFGRLAKACGTLFIQRGSGDAESVAKQMAAFLKQGYSIIFYPEGTTSDGRQVKRLHGKLLQSAIDANAPIQPIVLCYVNERGELDDTVPYYGGMSLKQSLLQVLDSAKVTAYVLPLQPIEVSGITKNELTDILQARMQEGLIKLQQQVAHIPEHNPLLR